MCLIPEKKMFSGFCWLLTGRRLSYDDFAVLQVTIVHLNLQKGEILVVSGFFIEVFIILWNSS